MSEPDPMTDDPAAVLGRLSLAVPAEWEDRTTVTLVGPSRDGFAQNIVVTRERLCAGMGLGAYSQGYVARLREQVAVDELEAVEHVTIAGRRGHVRRLGWEVMDGDDTVSIHQLVGMVVDGADAYALVATGTREDAAAIEPVFRAAIESMTLEGAAERTDAPAADSDEDRGRA